MIALCVASLLISEGSYLPYKDRIIQIDQKLAKLPSALQRSEVIRSQNRKWFASNSQVSDVELFGVIYKQVYEAYYLCMAAHREQPYWTAKMFRQVNLLKPSIEKTICLAYLDQNNDGWMFDTFPNWRKNSLLACILVRRSTGGCTTASRFKTYRAAFDFGSTLRDRSQILYESIQAAYPMAEFHVTKDTKFLRPYIDRVREYVSHTPDPKDHQNALKEVDLLERIHFPKK